MNSSYSPNAERQSCRARRALVGAALPAALAIAAVTASVGAQERSDIDELLMGVGERVAQLYSRAQHVIGIEISTVQPISSRYSPEGFARTVEAELRVETDESGAPTIVREILKVNGRPPRERDKKDRDGCTDPTPLSSEPLAFLLPGQRAEYEFRLAGSGKDRNRPVILVDFATVNRRSKVELIEDKAGHDDCFDWSGPVASRGRIWVDERTYDVVRVDRTLRGPLDVKVPQRIQRRHLLDPYVVIEREDTSIRYRRVTFSDPDEELLLPESVDSLILTRGGLQSTRRNQTYSDYRRFVGDARIVE